MWQSRLPASQRFLHSSSNNFPRAWPITRATAKAGPQTALFPPESLFGVQGVNFSQKWRFLEGALKCDLHRRTGHGRVGTIHAAVGGLGLQHSPAVTAIVEPLTGVGRHRLRFGVTACRTSDGCLQYYRCFLRRHIAYPVIARKTNSTGSRIGSRYPA